MNRELVRDLAQTISTLSSEERQLLLQEVQEQTTRDTVIKKLEDYQQQHSMSSEVFYRQFMAGELDDRMDYIEWAGFYELLLCHP
jgi:hypothetical protein